MSIIIILRYFLVVICVLSIMSGCNFHCHVPVPESLDETPTYPIASPRWMLCFEEIWPFRADMLELHGKIGVRWSVDVG